MRVLAKFSELEGKILASAIVSADRDKIEFRTYCGLVFEMYHDQDCCEHVCIESIDGDLGEIAGQLIVTAEESTQEDPNALESATWTFYRIGTPKDWIVIRWYGESNGYYSESVDFYQVVFTQ